MAAPPVDCPADCGWTWTQTWFGDCVCGDRDEASFLLGLASILAWGTAELPQIYANFKNGKSEGVSFAFVATWLTGDCFNLLGCAVSPTLPTQLYTALLYTATTIVLIVQHVYYNARRAESSDARILKNLPEEDLEDLEARLLDDSHHPESPESPAGEGEERGDAATQEGGESESRDASDAEDSSDDEERRRPRVRRDSGAFSVASVASEAASELAERGEAAAETARRPSTRRVSFGASAGGHRAARHSLPSSTKPSSARTGRREGGSASRDRDRGGANASGGGSGGLISASVPSRGGFSAWLAGANTPGSSRAPEGSAPSSARTFIAGTTTSGFSRSSGPGRRSVDASGRVRVEGFHQRRDEGEAARARRASFSLWPLSRNPRASGEGGEGGGLPRAVAAAAATTGCVGVAAFGGLRSARRGNFFSTPPRGVGVRRALLSAAAGYNHKPLIGSAPSWLGPALGWAMTGIYLGGRVPQIVLNHRRGSVEGLSISMFALAVLGNATYMASILARSCAWWRIKPNLPWLTDAAACLLMDAVILSQYWRFKGEERRRRASERLS
jgi:hypothetical protein